MRRLACTLLLLCLAAVEAPAQGPAAIPGSRLVEIEEAGHLPQVEAFDRYWRSLEEFLGASSTRAFP